MNDTRDIAIIFLVVTALKVLTRFAFLWLNKYPRESTYTHNEDMFGFVIDLIFCCVLVSRIWP